MPSAKTIRTRIVFGTIMTAALVGLLLLDNWLAVRFGDQWAGVVLAVLVVVLSLLALRELSRMAASAGAGILPVSALVGTVLVGTLPLWRAWCPFASRTDGTGVLAIAALVVMAAFLEQIARRGTQGALLRVACTVMAAFYLGLGAAMMLAIRLHAGGSTGPGLLVLFLAAVKSTDVGAYFTGTAIGRHKMIPWLSPGKSWEGLAGGLAAAAAVSVLATWALLLPLSLGAAAAFGVIVGGVGQFGDLAESLLKRSASVKDSGALVPEFGGVLDILDSPLIAASVAWVLLAWMTGG
jgi:phosphatidate cytidylyltransferase